MTPTILRGSTSSTPSASAGVHEIQKADPSAVRRALAILAGGAVAGVVLIAIARDRAPAFEAWLKQDLRGRVPLTLGVVTLLTVGPLLGLSGYLWQLGRRVIGAQRYPPPGLRLVRDTNIALGSTAIKLGHVIQAFAGIVAAAAVTLAFLLWRLAVALLP